ncbi:Predicted phosphodiesterase [Mesorhizobium albiziae]|uniref:Predicted phosphodiesterase n=1 Tax=Neomesorhizobium albiziae TaxID=335020 RepID=A0A1I3Z0J7_9HYPH|nr:metallophosphoesterase family protein [Mesorhizobium albiziae]GLS33156.1 DNA methylase [Mesorhizobium albiziae]SFK37583.1 Predicted phosphodiesterase [Mesorhizobium albiziae]
MRLAIVSDIHGNLRALEAVYAHIRQNAPDVIVNLGDCLSGPLWPEETAQYLIAEGWPTVHGNHDRTVARTPADTMEPVDRFTHETLSAGSLAWLSGLPLRAALDGDILLCHGSPTDDETFLLEEDGDTHFFPSNEAQIRAKLGDFDASLVLCGHTHTPRVVSLSGRQVIVNPGSVGVQAFPGLTVTGSPHARYALATRTNGTWSVSHHTVGYDWAAAADRAVACGSPDWRHGLLTGYAARSIQSQ